MIKNILVTGGLGYIGSHLCAELIKKKSTTFQGMKFKPGFTDQYSEVRDIIKKKKKNYTLCSLDSAIKVLYLMEMILKKSQTK